MLPLALVMKARGANVRGSDRAYDQGRVPERFSYIKQQDIALFPQDGSGLITGVERFVVSAAVEETVADYQTALKNNIPVTTRADLLSEVFNDTPSRIGIAGTSGKSTVTAMVGWILSCAANVKKKDAPTIINGATMKNFASDEHPFASFHVGDACTIVAEIDESDGSITQYNPTIAVINNVAFDHKSMDELRELFSGFAARAEKAIINLDNAETAKLQTETSLTFSLKNDKADLLAQNIDFTASETQFDLKLQNEKKAHHVTLHVPGDHNISNALAALGVAVALNVDIELAVDALAFFKGTARRYDVIGEVNDITVIDDFAHNPDKIAATLRTLRQSDGKVQILFQPHGFAPLALMRKELAASFAEGMKDNDTLTLCDPLYLGGTTNREVTSADLAADVTALGKTATHIADREDAAATLISAAQSGDKIVVMGARDDSLTTLAKSILEQLG